MKTFPLLLLFCAALPAGFADDKKPASAAPEKAGKESAVPAEGGLTVVDSTEIDAIRANEQRKVAMRGKVIRTNEWDGKGDPAKSMNFVDLDGGYFTIVTWAEAYPKFPNGHPATLYHGRTIEVTGTISKHNNRFQMKLEDPAQVRIVDDEKAKGEKKGRKASSRDRRKDS